jgi:hypothetical protein
MPVTDRYPEDDAVSEYRGGIPGWQLEKEAAEILRLDGADHSA